MSDEKKQDEAGRIRTPMSPATWVADETPEPAQGAPAEPEPKEPKKTTKKASE